MVNISLTQLSIYNHKTPPYEGLRPFFWSLQPLKLQQIHNIKQSQLNKTNNYFQIESAKELSHYIPTLIHKTPP